MKTYVTVEGDMVDLIAWHQTGTTEKTTEALLEVNPQIAKRGPVLPAGLILILPEIEVAPPVARSSLKLWD